MVAMPQWTDQMTNAKFVDSGIVGRGDIELCIRKVEREKRLEIRLNATKWMEAAARRSNL